MCRLSVLYKSILVLLLPIIPIVNSHSQYKIRYDDHNLSSLVYGPDKNNGFRISLSLVMMFTHGAADRDGIRIGAGLTFSQTFDHITVSTGVDTYKAKQQFGLGTTFAGLQYDTGRYGASYYVNKYHQGDKQISGLIRVHINDFVINFEDDILALPFSGFKAYDRYRTAALEFRYKGFMIGTNVYTTDIDGRTDASVFNSRGIYTTGQQISSPIYWGYTDRDIIIRYGLNNRSGGLVGQNGWHRLFFNTPDFGVGDYKNHFFQIGIDKPYTLY